MATEENYHLSRTLNELCKGQLHRTITWFVREEIRLFDKLKLKPTFQLPRQQVFHYSVLPIDQRIEDLQAKVHRVSSAKNTHAALIDVKRDIKILYQEFKVYEQEKIKEVDDAYTRGYSEAVFEVQKQTPQVFYFPHSK